MPSTITTYHTFVAATKARAAQVNTNFANHRGDLLPINEDTASSSHNTHHLGASDHRWLGSFVNYLDIKGATTTAQHQIYADTSLTAGAFIFAIGSTTVARIKPTGFDGAYIAPASITDTAMGTLRTLYGVTIGGGMTVSHTIPSNVTNVLLKICAPGGGGGGGGGYSGGTSGSGGGGGAASLPLLFTLEVTAGDVLTISVGANGTGGAGGGTGASGTAGVAANPVTVGKNGTTMITVQGGGGGQGGAAGSGGGGGGGGSDTHNHLKFTAGGGAGGAGTSGDGSDGPNSFFGTGGTGGTHNNSGGGGGGAAGWGNGGRGGNADGVNEIGAAGSGYGSGGGGGCGGVAGLFTAGSAGGSGAAGTVILYYNKTS